MHRQWTTRTFSAAAGAAVLEARSEEKQFSVGLSASRVWEERLSSAPSCAVHNYSLGKQFLAGSLSYKENQKIPRLRLCRALRGVKLSAPGLAEGDL